MERIRVGVVEDDRVWLKHLIRYLETHEDLAVLWSANTKEDCVRLIDEQPTDVVLMDINLSGSGLDGIDAAFELVSHTSVKVLMLTSLSAEDIILDSFTAGALDYVQKKDYHLLYEKIRSVVKNVSPQEILIRDYNRLKREEQVKELSPAEKEVFGLLEEGYTKTEIENKLFKSKDTLKNQIKSLIRKLGVKSSKEAIEKVKRRGLK